MRRLSLLRFVALFACSMAFFLSDHVNGQTDTNQLAKEFASPASEYRPWVYWFWNNGNLTEEGIKADLEAMHRVGIGGVLVMEVDQGAPRGPVDYMSKQWRDMFQYMLAEAQKHGMEVNMNNGPGWNGSAGPWIKPEEAMQMLSWSELKVDGSGQKTITLKKPDVRCDYYRDIVVWAFPTPKDLSTKEPLGPNVHRRATPSDKVTQRAVVERENLVDLSDRMTPEGTLTWDVPQGSWIILRVGHTCKGTMARPGPASGMGLECDKLSIRGADAMFAGQMAKLVSDNEELAGKVLVATHIDSWENGSQNWTSSMREDFMKRRQYDLLPFLPVFAGYVVDTPEITERFLWDFRRTVSELVLDHYVRRIRDLANQHHLRLTAEAYHCPCDFFEYAGIVDEPMSEFWIGELNMPMTGNFGMASSAHIYGKTVVGAEACTADDSERWLQHPGLFKTLGDQAFATGINRFVFHRYSFQPWNDIKPGMMMGPWGIHYERTQTWWELTPAWHQYLTRCQYMLRQGMYCADICYVEPEDSPQGLADHPHLGYPWDQCGTHAVYQMTVRDGMVVSEGGMRYRILVLPQNERMTPELLTKVMDLIRNGATVIGSRPKMAFGLTDYPNKDLTIQQLAGELWGEKANEKTGEQIYGRGRIVWGKTAETLLQEQGIPCDFTSNRHLNQIHRKTDMADIYFIANPSNAFQLATAEFRVKGQPEIWHPETGEIKPLAIYRNTNDTTTTLLPLEATESVFVVFRKDGNIKKHVEITAITEGGRILADLNHSPSSTVRIDRAIYAVPHDETTAMDVTSTIQKMVESGMTGIPVSQMAKIVGDPKSGTKKTLRIEYTAESEKYTISGEDGETVYFGGFVPSINVLSASYGLLEDTERTLDVTEKLQKMFDAGENRFRVSRLAREADPASGIIKTLTMTYESGGKTTTWKGNDEMLVNVERLYSPMNKKVKPCVDNQGWPCLEFWNSGKYGINLVNGKNLDFDVTIPNPLEITGPWRVEFPEKQTSFDTLISWTDSQDDFIKYYSGTAVYHKSFSVPQELLDPNQRIYLDLGQVDSIAKLTLNGQELGILWKLDKIVDITDILVKNETNNLEVQVTNLWPNRLIGDEHLPDNAERNHDGALLRWPEWLLEGQPDPSGRETFCMWNLWSQDDTLLPSGLIGPVRLISVKKVCLN